jgi:hypothetical protein
MAKLIGYYKDMPRYDYDNRPENFDFDAHYKAQEEVMKHLEDESAKSLEDDNPVGFLLNFHVGDGYATYRVVSTKPLSLELVPFGDAYQVSAAHIRGLNMTDVRQEMERAKIWRTVKRASH